MNALTRNKKRKAEALLEQHRPAEAQALYRQVCEADGGDAEAWFMLGLSHGQQGELEALVECTRRALALRPDHAEAHFNLGKALLALGHRAEAEAHYHSALEIRPDWPQALNNLGNLLQGRGAAEEALRCYARALAIQPDYTQAWINQANVQQHMGRNDAAEAGYRQALALNPAAVDAYRNLAQLLTARGGFTEALACYRAVARYAPGQIDMVLTEAQLLERQGDSQGAFALIQPRLEQGVVNAELALLFASLCRALGRCDEARAMLQQVLDRPEVQADPDTCAALHFKLGALLDAAAEYDAAFVHFQCANELKPYRFDSAAFATFVDRLIATFSPEFVARMARARHGSARPLFIVGMPRSGTSLVEQILASHPQVCGAGELEDIRLLVGELPTRLANQTAFPECVAELTAQLCDELARPYLDRLKQLSVQARYVSNKMPENFLHLGVIAMLFPRARIIHCRRDPLDTCLSCYFNDFRGAHAYAYDLEHLGRYYHHYQRLMRHWQSVLDLPMLELVNEELVAEQEGVTRRLLAFCELEWEPACMRFYEHDRVVNTVSYQQVRRPITTASIGRWRNYADYLEPLRRALDPQ